eukprot:12481287-Alexandrium_andersonii.AAC.1
MCGEELAQPRNEEEVPRDALAEGADGRNCGQKGLASRIYYPTPLPAAAGRRNLLDRENIRGNGRQCAAA